MARWRWAGGGLALGALLAVMRCNTSDPAAPAPRGSAGARPELAGRSSGSEGPVTERSVPPSESHARDASFAAHVTAVGAACGIGAQTVCEPGGCVAVVRSPDLERFQGWVELLGVSPAFVVGTAARDLGLPEVATPCGSAIDALSDQAHVIAVELASGEELWCAVPAVEADQLSRCDRAVRSAWGTAGGFANAPVRELSFRTP
jgi:hypothetical protein